MDRRKQNRVKIGHAARADNGRIRLPKESIANLERIGVAGASARAYRLDPTGERTPRHD
jgi:hypothetical protein